MDGIKLNHGSTFSGIGGFDLAAQWMGWDNRFHVEQKPFNQRILKHYWPKAASYADIKTTDFTIWRYIVDVLSGGFPCQPYSIAGKRKGKDDERHLWPEMLRAIRECCPSWVVGENVLGLVNWDGGLVFDEIQTDLENEGFEVLPPFILPACAVGAPHRRDRVWFVAYSSSNRERKQDFISKGNEGQRTPIIQAEDKERTRQAIQRNRVRRLSRSYRSRERWDSLEDRSPILRDNDGLSERLDGLTLPKWRAESNAGFGNAIVPQVAIELFKVIEEIELTL